MAGKGLNRPAVSHAGGRVHLRQRQAMVPALEPAV
jgi:hypothetical protein